MTISFVLLAEVGWGAELPNIVVFMADDMGMGDTSAYQDITGNGDDEQILTPSMERLARRGIRFTDAHTSSTRCTNTRYGLLTGRYAWRSRMKWWVLFGAQGDPLIEPDRSTVATLLRDAGYATAMVGKWHVGLRYRRSDDSPAAGFEDADLTRALLDTPLDHGFEKCWFTSRSHGTSGPQAGQPRNRPDQTVGPGHVHGRIAVGANGAGRQLVDDGSDAYVLTDLGGRHSDHAIRFLEQHLEAEDQRPFFLYYASNSNHAPYTPDDTIDDVSVAGASRSVAGEQLDQRSDFVYENDVALGRLITFLDRQPDPRSPGHALSHNTIVIFTSDNGAEIESKTATGPFRSNKGSVYEGGHRVPFMVAWPAGGVGDGSDETPGATSGELIALHDLYATFTEIVAGELPALQTGNRGGEDSTSVLAAWRGGESSSGPLFHNDHKQADDPAASAIRIDDPVVDGKVVPGKWKLFFDAGLLRFATINPIELYELESDPTEQENRIDDPSLTSLVKHLSDVALQHRTAGGHRFVPLASDQRITFDWQAATTSRNGSHAQLGLAGRFAQSDERLIMIDVPESDDLQMTIGLIGGLDTADDSAFNVNDRGLGVSGGAVDQVDQGEAIEVMFNRDVIVESAAIVAGKGQCGGFFQVGQHAPQAIYCIDGDIDAKDQSGLLSDIGWLPADTKLRFSSAPYLGVEAPGQWRLGGITIRLPR